MKKGFTLIELLGVIIVLSVILTIITPKIINQIKNSNDTTTSVTKELIYNAASEYINDNKNDFKKTVNAAYCISLKELVDLNYIKGPILVDQEDITNTGTVKITYNNEYIYELSNKKECSVLTYTGKPQEWIAPKDGYYHVQLWGAQGGSALYTTEYTGGLGAYTTGTIYLKKGTKLTITVGGVGHIVSGTTTFTKAGTGFNGGAVGSASSSNSTHGGGGGATDIRYNGTSLNDRIMVAAGGGGASSHVRTPNYSGNGGEGGTLTGGTAEQASDVCYAYGTGGSQTSGGISITVESNRGYGGMAKFGIGESTYTEYTTAGAYSGGGAGYYGGGTGFHAAAGGGSSFISGYAGVDAITSSTNLTPTHDTIHYSGKYFIDTDMKSGKREGNGKAVIAYVGTEIERTNKDLDNVRYIRQCANGNTVNGGVHLVEFQAIYQGKNIAKGKTITEQSGKTQTNSSYLFTYAVDGDLSNFTYNDGWAYAGVGNICFIVDLGSTYNLDEIASWLYWPDGRTHFDSTISVSSNKTSWIEVSRDEDAETSQGVHVSAYN